MIHPITTGTKHLHLESSNLAFAQWTTVFGDATLTAALLDRLTHHCSIHDFNWESIRFSESMQRMKSVSKKAANRAVAATAPPEGAKKVRNQEGAQTPHDSYSIFLIWVGPICFITAGPFYFDIAICPSSVLNRGGQYVDEEPILAGNGCSVCEAAFEYLPRRPEERVLCRVVAETIESVLAR